MYSTYHNSSIVDTGEQSTETYEKNDEKWFSPVFPYPPGTVLRFLAPKNTIVLPRGVRENRFFVIFLY